MKVLKPVIAAQLAGCYYWQPLEVIDVNARPFILHSDPPIGEPLEITEQSLNTAFVVVQDLNDPEMLIFQWYISGVEIIGPGEQILQEGFTGSKVSLSPINQAWNNRTLNCVVYDSYNESTSASWPLIVLEGN